MRLSEAIIHKMVIAYNEGRSCAAIAKDFAVDTSTVRYHIERIETMYGTTSAVYSLIKPKQKPCNHPSLQCLVCGMAADQVHSREKEKIHHLQQALIHANKILNSQGFESVGDDLIQ